MLTSMPLFMFDSDATKASRVYVSVRFLNFRETDCGQLSDSTSPVSDKINLKSVAYTIALLCQAFYRVKVY